MIGYVIGGMKTLKALRHLAHDAAASAEATNPLPWWLDHGCYLFAAADDGTGRPVDGHRCALLPSGYAQVDDPQQVANWEFIHTARSRMLALASALAATLDIVDAAAGVVAARRAGVGRRGEMHEAIDKMEAALARLNGDTSRSDVVIGGGCAEVGL